MSTLSPDDLAYLRLVQRNRAPLSSAPGFEAFPVTTLREIVAAELASDEGTVAWRAWVQRAAVRLGIT